MVNFREPERRAAAARRDTSPRRACDRMARRRRDPKSPRAPSRTSSRPTVCPPLASQANAPLRARHCRSMTRSKRCRAARECCGTFPASEAGEPSVGVRSEQRRPDRDRLPGAAPGWNPSTRKFRVGKCSFSSRNTGRRLHHVAQRTGFENEDFHANDAKRGTPQCSHRAERRVPQA